MTLPSNPADRKALPITTGVLDYFPDALAAVAEVSKMGNDQHNPGQPLHWSKDKSTDHADCIVRHLIERGTLDTDGGRHSAKVAWRALANLQIEIENERAAEDDDDRATPGLDRLMRDPGVFTATATNEGADKGFRPYPPGVVKAAFHPDLTELERVAIETGSEVVHEDRCPACEGGGPTCDDLARQARDAGPDFPAWH